MFHSPLPQLTFYIFVPLEMDDPPTMNPRLGLILILDVPRRDSWGGASGAVAN